MTAFNPDNAHNDFIELNPSTGIVTVATDGPLLFVELNPGTGNVKLPTVPGSLVINGGNKTPGIVSGRFYSTFRGNTSSSAAVTILDTKIFLYPFYIDTPISPSALSIRVITAGAAGSAVKLGIWANGSNGRPTGLALTGLVSNTGQATTSTGANAAITATGTLDVGWYWFGAAFTTAAPVCLSTGITVLELDALQGRTTLGTNDVGGITAPYTYSTDITTLDLTSATWTDAIAPAGNPVLYLTAP